MSNMNYSKIRCAGRIAIFLAVCLVGSVLVSAPFLSLLLNNDDDATVTQSMTDYIAMACSAFLLAALAVEDKIEKLDLWAIGRSRLQIKVVFISVLLGLLWQLSIYLICQFCKAAYPHSTTTELSPLLISVVATGLLGPFTEEMLFRKWLVSMMERSCFKPIIRFIRQIV